MNNRKIAWALILLLCATALFSGTLLILHAGHSCHQTTCPICIVLTHSDETLLYAAAMLYSIGLCIDAGAKFSFDLSENRVVSDWTPVRRKVKLQD